MKSAHVWFLLALLPLLAGCISFPTIYSEQPLGETAVLDPEKWNGRWLGNNGEVSTWTVVGTDTVAATHIFKAGRKVSNLCHPSPDDMEHLAVREYRGCCVQSWYILSKVNDKKILTEDGLYKTSLLIRLEGRSMYWSFVNEQRVKALVEQGELPGRIEADRVILGALTQEHYKLLLRNRGTEVEYPMPAKDDYPDVKREAMAIKLPDELDPCKRGDKGN